MRTSIMPPRSRLLLLGTSALTGFSALAPTAQAGQPGLPTNGTVSVGSATIAQAGANQLTVTTGTSRTVIDWQSFSIASGNKVAIQQPGASSITVNEVTGGDPSKIFGDLSSNGRVVLANPNGIWFGPNSHVDVAGLVASTATLSADAKKAFASGGRLSLDVAGKSTASIVNDGQMTIAGAGLAALVAPGVRNNGVIEASLGSVTLASGQTSTLDFYGDGLVSLAVTSPVQAVAIGPDGKPFKATIENNGKLAAQHVLVTADVVKGVVDNSINMSGVVEAKGVTVSGGDIVLDGGEGDVSVAGTLDVSSQQAKGGSVAVTGGTVVVASSAKIDASGAKGGGTIKVGGGPHGAGALRHATAVLVQGGSSVLANATAQGDGGTVSIWSDGQTTFNGTIEAKGAGTGNGGWVETSGHYLSISTGRVDASSPAGLVGTWLLDPYALEVASGGNANSSTNTYTSSSAGITVLDSNINASLSGADVILQTGGPGGNITVDSAAAINWSGTEHLTLDATANGGTGNIAIGGTISGTAGTLTLKSVGTITQSQPITVENLELLGGGAVTLNYSNQIGTLAGNVQSINLVDTVALTIGTAGSTTGLTSIGATSIQMSGTDATFDAAANIAAGSFSLSGANGNSDHLLGITTENGVSITAANGGVSLSTSGTSGTGILVQGPISASAGNQIGISGGAITIDSSLTSAYFNISGTSITVGNDAALTATQYTSYLVASGAYTGNGTLPFTLASGSSITANAGSIYLSADEVSIGGPINAGTNGIFIGPYNSGVTVVLGSSGINSSGNHLDLTTAELGMLTAATLEFGYGYYSVTPAAITTMAALDFGSDTVTFSGGVDTINNNITAGVFSISNAATGSTSSPVAVTLATGAAITTTAGGISISAGGTGSDILLQGALVAGGTSSGGSPLGYINISGTNITMGGGVTANSSLYVSAASSSSLTIGAGAAVSALSFSLYGGTVSIGAGANLGSTGTNYDSSITAYSAYSNSNSTVPFTLGTGGSISTTNGTFTLAADEVSIAGPISAGTGQILIEPYNANVAMTLGAPGINPAGSHLDLTTAELADLTAATLTLGDGYYYQSSITTGADLNFGSKAVTLAGGVVTINNNITAGAFSIQNATSNDANNPVAVTVASGNTITTTAGGISITTSGTGTDILLQGALVAGGLDANNNPLGTIYLSGGNVTVGGTIQGNASMTLNSNVALNIDTNLAASGQLYLYAGSTGILTVAPGVAISGAYFDLYGGTVSIGSNASVTGTSGAGYSSNILAYSAYNGSGTVPFALGTGASITTSNGILTLTADEVSIAGTISAGTGQISIGSYNTNVALTLGSSGINPAGNHLDLTTTALAALTAGSLVLGDGYYYQSSITTAADLNFGSKAVTLAGGVVTINNNITAGAFTIQNATTNDASNPVAVTIASGTSITTTAGGISISAAGTGTDILLQGALIASGTDTNSNPVGSVYLSGGRVTVSGPTQANSSVSIYGAGDVNLNANIASGGVFYVSTASSSAVNVAPAVALSAAEFNINSGTVTIGTNASVAGTTASEYNYISASNTYGGSGAIPFVLGNGASLTSNNGTISLTADEVSIAGPINAGTGSILIGAYNTGVTLTLGSSGINSAGSHLDLTKAELAELTAQNLGFGYGYYYYYYDQLAAIETAADLNFGSANVSFEGGQITISNNITAGSFYATSGYTSSSVALSVAAGASITTTAGGISIFTNGGTSGDISIQGSLIAGGTDINGNAIGSLSIEGNNVTLGGSVRANSTVYVIAETGDVTINAPLTVTGTNYLDLAAAHSVLINANITAAGSNSVYLTSNFDDDTTGGSVQIGTGASITLGSGSSLDIDGRFYTIITSASALQSMSATGNYALGNDIDASSISSFTPIGTPTSTDTASTSFTGNFNGLGHAIDNLSVSNPASNNLGLFNTIAATATVSNIGLVAGSVIGSVNTGFANVGLLAGTNLGTITNAFSTGAVVGDVAGGLVGFNDGSIANAYSTASVNGSLRIGGLVGYNHVGTITNAYATGSVTGTAGAQFVGGLVGDNGGTITAVYSAGAVGGGSGSGNLGGLVGNNSGTVTDGYWDTQASGQTSSAAGTGMTTAELQAALPSGFDPTVWGITAGGAYPSLANLGAVVTMTGFDTISGIATTLTGGLVVGGSIALYVNGSLVGSVLTTDGNGAYSEMISSAVLLNANSTLAGSLTVGGNVTGLAYADGIIFINSAYSGFNLVSGQTRIATVLPKYSTVAAAEAAAFPSSVLTNYAAAVPMPALSVTTIGNFTLDQTITGISALQVVDVGTLAVTANISGPTVSLQGSIVDLGGAITTPGGAVTINGATVLTAASAIDTTNGGAVAAGGAITFAGTLDGGFGLTLNAGTAGVALNGSAGAQAVLGGLTITAGTITLSNVSTAGAQVFNGTTTLNGTYVGSSFTANGVDLLGGATGVTATAGNISFGSTVNGGQSLTLTDTAGTVSFSNSIGAQNALGSLTITAAGIVAGSVKTTGSQIYGGALTLSSAPTILSVNGDLTFGGTINGTQSLILSAGGNIVFGGTVATQVNPTALSVLTANNVTVINNSTLWITTFAGFATGTFDFGDHSLESDDVVTIQANSVDGRVVSSNATLNVNTASGTISGNLVSVTASGAVNEQITAGAASVSDASFSGSVAAVRSADISSTGDTAGNITVSGGNATISGANVAGNIVTSGLAQIFATADVSAGVTGGSVNIQAGQTVSGAITSTGPGGVIISAMNVTSNILAEGGGPVTVAATNSISGSVTGGAISLTAPNVNETIDANTAVINSPNQTLIGTIGGSEIGFANNITQEILGATQEVADKNSSNDNASNADDNAEDVAGNETDDERKKKKAPNPVYDFANQYIDKLVSGRQPH